MAGLFEGNPEPVETRDEWKVYHNVKLAKALTPPPTKAKDAQSPFPKGETLKCVHVSEGGDIRIVWDEVTGLFMTLSRVKHDKFLAGKIKPEPKYDTLDASYVDFAKAPKHVCVKSAQIVKLCKDAGKLKFVVFEKFTWAKIPGVPITAEDKDREFPTLVWDHAKGTIYVQTDAASNVWLAFAPAGGAYPYKADPQPGRLSIVAKKKAAAHAEEPPKKKAKAEEPPADNKHDSDADDDEGGKTADSGDEEAKNGEDD